MSTSLKLFLFLVMTSLCSCAYFSAVKSSSVRNKVTSSESPTKRSFVLKDQSGRFVLKREVGMKKSDGTFIVKRSVAPEENPGKIVEKSISISGKDKLGKLEIFVPRRSQYTVYFEKKKYFTELNFEKNTRMLNIKMISPESHWNGQKSVQLPKGTGVYCFYSQIVDCARVTGFIEKASQANAGKMNLHILWDGYPYFHEQYVNMLEEPFSPAVLSFDGKNDQGERRFSLSFQQQVIYLFVDRYDHLSKVFWVSQGYSLSPGA